MANKPFAIQGADLTLGGVNLSAGATTIVIPGVTQAVNYIAEEVDDRDGSNPSIFGSNVNAVTVIDNSRYLQLTGTAPSGSYVAATYSVDELDDGQIEEVNVESAGVYEAADKTRAEASNMWATLTPTPFASFNSANWTQIPFRPKMRAGVVENVGGGSGGIVERGVEFPQGEEGDTAGVLASDNSTLYYSTADWVDVNDINKTFAVENATDYNASQSGFQYNFIDFLAADYPDLQTILTTLSNTNNGIVSSDFTVDGGVSFGGAQTAYQISSNSTTITVGWTHRVGVDPTTIAQGDDFTVVYTGTIAQPAIWTRILSSDITTSVTEYATGLIVADKDFEIRTTRSDPGQDADVDIYAADDVFIEAGGDDVVITAADEVIIESNNDGSTYTWTFNNSGHVEFPDGSIQVTAYIAGTSDNNIWVETFTSDAQTTDFVQAATSVEYDATGNIFALFNHSIPTPNSETYTSVAKLSPAGTVLWQVRFSVNLNTDGWGLAYDGVDTVYVAGSTDGTPLTYEFATLTKIDAADGTIVWSKTYDFEADSQSAVVDVDSDLNPVMVGYAYNGTDNYIITTKVDSADGLVIWCKTIDGQGYDQAYGMAVGPTGEVVTIGYVDKLLPTDSVATAVTVPTSNVNWTTPHTNALTNGVNFDIDISAGVPTIIINTDDTGGRVVGDTFATILGSTLGGQDGDDDMIVKVDTLAVNDDTDRMVVIKYATDGTIAWQKAVQFDAGYNCSGADADIDSLGNIYVCGQYSYNAGGAIGTTSAMNLIKFNSSGVKQWSRRVVGNCDTFATSVVVGPDNNLYLSGVTGNDITDQYTWVVAKYDTAGVVVWQRLIDNTTTWTFGGSFWFGGAGGGSNIAVGNGYVALAGSFGDPGTQPKATIVQIDTDATEFSVGDWDIEAATFSGVLNGTASDITVTDAGKTTGTAAPTASNFVTIGDSSNFLSATRAGAASGDSINNGAYSVSVGSNGVVTMATSRGSLEFGALPEIGGQAHFHIMKTAGDTADLFLGDDFNYVLQRGPATVGLPAYGVEIGTNDNDGGTQQVWRFGTDGTTIFPTLTVPRGDDPSGTITGQTLLFGDSTQEAIISTPDGTIANSSSQRLVLNPGKGYEGGEGGDIYLWAGRGGNASGTGGDIKIRGGQGGANTGGGSGGDGGYIRIEAGDAASTGGDAGYVDIHGGLSTTSGGAVNIRTATTNTFNHAWQFGNNGTLTLPKASKVSEVTPATGPAPSIYPTPGVSSIPNEDFVTTPPPAIYNYTIPGTDIVINMTFGANGPSFYGPTATIVNGGSGHTSDESLMIPYADMGIDLSGNWEWFVNAIASNLVLEAGTKDWTFAADGKLTLPDAGIVKVGVAAAQVGSALTIANDGSGGLIGWGANSLSVAYNAAILSTYTAGSTITFQDGSVRTISAVEDYTSYIDISWHISKTGTLFPITLKTTNYVAAKTSAEWEFGTDGSLTFPDATVQTTAFVQGEQVFTLDTGAIDYAPTTVDFNLLFVTPAIGYSGTDPTSVTLPAGVPGQRLVIFNGSSLATLTVNPGLLGRDISGGVVAEFIYSGFDGVWIPLYGTNSPT